MSENNNSTMRKEKNMIKRKKRLALFCFLIVLLLSISVSANATKQVYLGGMPFGVRFDAGEVVILKTNAFVSCGKNVCPAEDAGIMPNDIIKSINGSTIHTSLDVVNAVRSSDSSKMEVVINRSGKDIAISLSAVVSDQTGEKQLGVMLKDSSAGIGTVTFIDEDTVTFGGLGHGICDAKSGNILNIENGYISDVTISSINSGKVGAPGELRGIIDMHKKGKLLSNTEVGLYGVFTESPKKLNKKIEVADTKDIKVGKATILCTLDDNKCNEYCVEIAAINSETSAKTKNFVIKVTDEKLLRKTGGIVQGMSGSPIIQNGKLVGAVTHVMINDPTTGYGIYIGNMLDEISKIK